MVLDGWRSCQRHSGGQAKLAAVCSALILTCKETAVLHLFALAAAALAFWLWNLRGKSLDGVWSRRALMAAATVFIVLSVMLFTWFGSNWKALPDLLQAVPNFLARAGGEGHQKPFWYYAQLLTGGWSGGLISALACIGVIQTMRRRDPSPYGFLAYYAVFLAVIYSLIPYKTPWLALNFWLPIALFAGLAIKSLWHMQAMYPARRIAISASCILVGAV